MINILQCFKTISIAGQGVKALESHAKSSKHNEKLPKSTSSIIKFTSKKTETSNAEPVTEYTSKSKKQSTITDFGGKTHTQNAEIFWDITAKHSRICWFILVRRFL